PFFARQLPVADRDCARHQPRATGQPVPRAELASHGQGRAVTGMALPESEAGQDAQNAPRIVRRGVEPYQESFDAMRAFTAARGAQTADEVWIVEHPAVFTLGLGADPAHVLDARGIPVVQTDRGGEVTYHGP